MPFDIKTDLRVQYQNSSGVWTNIEADTFEIDIDRGVDIEQGVFARPTVGTATVRMMKSSLSDFMTQPPFQSNQRIVIEYYQGAWIGLFSGFIQNIEMGYVAEAKASGSALTRGKLQVTLTAYDMGRIALNTQIGTFSITGTSARSFINVMTQLATAITAIDSRYSQTQALSGGSSTYQHAFTYLDVPSGELFAQFLDAELGWLWASRSGFMYFHTRADVNTIQSQTWDSNNLTVSNVHSNSTKHVCMDNIQMAYDSDAIANVVAVTETFNQTKTTQSNSTSITNFGRQVGRFEVNFNPASPSSTLAQWASKVASAANPKSVTQVSVPAITDLGEVSEIAQSEIGTALQVEFAQTGFTTIQELYMISRINHVIDADHWEMNVGLWRGI
jgi:hypothetical protein